MIITAFRVQNMAAQQIEALVPGDFLSWVKASGDINPEFRSYTIAHPGESKGTVITEDGRKGGRALQWLDRTIQRVSQLIKKWTPAFLLHNDDNSTNNRETVGQIVYSGMEGKDAKVIIYIKPEYRGKKFKLDAASFEGRISKEFNRDNTIYPGDVQEITGIALGDMSENQPAFERAGMELAVQMFTNAVSNNGDKIMTKEEIKKIIKELGLDVEDLFDIEKPPAEDRNQQNAFLRITKRVEHLEKQIAEKDGLLKQKDIELAKTKSGEVFNRVMKTRENLKNEKVISWFNDRKTEYDITLPENESEFSAYYNQKIDADINRYDDYIKYLSGKAGEPKKEMDKPQKPQTGPSMINTAGFDLNDFDMSLVPGNGQSNFMAPWAAPQDGPKT